MKKTTVVMLGLAMLTLINVHAAHEVVSLDGDWDFTFKSKLTEDTPKLPADADFDTQLRVPDYMNFQTDRLAKAAWGKPEWRNTNYIRNRGMAFYRRYIDAPADWAGKSIQLRVGQAYDRINVWLNGEHVVFHPYIVSIPLAADLSGKFKPGERNEIIISVDNQTALTHKFSLLGGIVEPVELHISNGPGRIDNLYITPGADLNEIVWQVELRTALAGHSIPAGTLKWVVTEWQSGRELGSGTVETPEIKDSSKITWHSRHPDIKTWHPNTPHLNVAKLTWERNGAVEDSLSQRFGLRRWSADGRILKLNDRPIFLRQHYAYIARACHWRYPQNKDFWIKYFQLIKARGYNGVDWLLGTAAPAALAAADEVGIVIQCGLFESAGRTYMRKDMNIKSVFQALPLWTELARWSRIYPSMSIYCAGGEMSYYDGFLDDACACNAAIKLENPESLFLPNQAMCGIEYSFAPEDRPHLTLKPFPHHAERLAAITKCSDIFGSYPGGGFSYNPLMGSWRTLNERQMIYQRPLVSHEVMLSNRILFMLPEDGRINTLRFGIQGVENIINHWGNWPTQRTGIERQIAALNKLSPSERAYRRQCYESMARLAGILFKYVGEKMRKCDTLAGYQDLCGHGGLNSFLEDSPGFTAERFRRFNGDNVLLLDWDNEMCLKHTWWEGEVFEATVMASLFGDTAITNGRLDWELKDNNEIIMQDSCETGLTPQGQISTIANIRFNWPETTRNRRLNLTLKLSGDGTTVRNDWDFWVFKHRPAPEIAAACSHNMYLLLKERYPGMVYLKDETADVKLRIIDMLDMDALTHLENGGDVLLVGGRPFPLYTQWPKFEQGYRNHHNHGSIVHPHPVFKDIPNDGWGDWQFYPLLNGSAPVSFRNERTPAYASVPIIHPQQDLMKHIPFNPILEIIHISRQADQASIFELNAGAGRLFVTTCATDMREPVSVTLFDSILEHISGPGFQPAETVTTDVLRAFLADTDVIITKYAVSIKIHDITGADFTSEYKTFGIAPKDAVFIQPKKQAVAIFNLSTNQIPATDKSHLALSIIGQDCDKVGVTAVEIKLNGRTVYQGANQLVKMGWSEWKIPFDKNWLINGLNTIEIRNLEAAVQRGYNWMAVAELAVKADDDFVKMTSHIPTEEQMAKDRRPPVLRLKATPPLDQRGHENIATRETMFELIATDDGAGVKAIEMSVDNAPYVAYTGPFSLGTADKDHTKDGMRKLHVRCTDHAGNTTEILTGASEEGRDLDCMTLRIKRAP